MMGGKESGDIVQRFSETRAIFVSAPEGALFHMTLCKDKN